MASLQMSDATTNRKHIRHVHVVVVHDPECNVEELCGRLRKEFVVRECPTTFGALSELATRQHACLICCVGGRIGAEEFRGMVGQVAKEQASLIVFIAMPSAKPEDFDCMERMGRHWLDHTVPVDEVLALVRAVSA